MSNIFVSQDYLSDETNMLREKNLDTPSYRIRKIQTQNTTQNQQIFQSKDL